MSQHRQHPHLAVQGECEPPLVSAPDNGSSQLATCMVCAIGPNAEVQLESDTITGTSAQSIMYIPHGMESFLQ
eukprot:501007-Amphidinium_carterae.2